MAYPYKSIYCVDKLWDSQQTAGYGVILGKAVSTSRRNKPDRKGLLGGKAYKVETPVLVAVCETTMEETYPSLIINNGVLKDYKWQYMSF